MIIVIRIEDLQQRWWCPCDSRVPCERARRGVLRQPRRPRRRERELRREHVGAVLAATPLSSEIQIPVWYVLTLGVRWKPPVELMRGKLGLTA